MKNTKVMDLHSTNIFKAIFAFICLFVIDFALLIFVNSFVENKYLVYTIVYTVITIFIFLKEKKQLTKKMHTLNKDFKSNWKNLLLVIISLLAVEFVINFILIKVIGQQPSNNQTIIDSFNGANVILILYYMLIIGPVTEGLIYFYPYNNVKNRLLAYIVFSTIFALFHITSTTSLLELLYFIPYLVMSFAFGYGFYKTDNIYVSIITHSLNNLLAFVLLFIM